MSSFINRTDYGSAIYENRLDQITQYDNKQLDAAENKAISFVKSHLLGRNYDVEQIFNATGESRDPLILGYTIDIAIYNLYRLVSPRKIPDTRREAYEDAKEWLEGVQQGNITPNQLPVLSGKQTTYITYGSNPKRENHI